MRCEKHGLAAGPEGECVVCLRESRTQAARRALRWVVGVVGVVLALCAAVLVLRTVRAQAESAATAARLAEESRPSAAVAEEQARIARAGRPPTSDEIQAAVRATPVLMFSTSWCPHCERARKYFRASGVTWVEKDIDTDAQAAAELKRRTGGRAIPVIEVDGQQLPPGFGEQPVLAAITSSVERRLGVSGLTLPLP